MNWFTRLFRRRPKPKAEAMARIIEERKPRGDIIGRQAGQKRNRTHVYRQPFGYPIRLCDWVAQDIDSIERIGETQGITGGPAELNALEVALDWAEAYKGAVICKHCLAIAQGKRGPVIGGPRGPA